MSNKPEIKSFIYVREINGSYQAVLMGFTEDDPEIPEGLWEPWQTGICHWPTKQQAEIEAKSWCEAEEIHYGMPEGI
jgi:hypothetical protein